MRNIEMPIYIGNTTSKRHYLLTKILFFDEMSKFHDKQSKNNTMVVNLLLILPSSIKPRLNIAFFTNTLVWKL